MSTAHRKGLDGEVRVAKTIASIFPNHNVVRYGGIEKHKNLLSGDIGCLKYKYGKKKCENVDDCLFDRFYFDVKFRPAQTNKRKTNAPPPDWIKKVEDDCEFHRPLADPILIYSYRREWLVWDGGEILTLDKWLDRLKVYEAEQKEG